MKRMYVALIFIFFIVFYAGTLLGQKDIRPIDDHDTSMEKRIKMREEMHRRIMEKLLRGVGPDQDMFKDMEQFMDEVMSDSFSGFNSFSRTTAQNYKMEWTESSAGRILEITPKSADQQLKIDISNGLIIIQGKNEVKTPNGISIANFSNSFNVPGDCDPAKVKIDQKDGKILVKLPYLTAKPADIGPKQEKRTPLPPSKDDVTI